jgi:hypothetical protein
MFAGGELPPRKARAQEIRSAVKKQSRVIETRDGKTKLMTLDQARAVVFKQSDRGEWNNEAPLKLYRKREDRRDYGGLLNACSTQLLNERLALPAMSDETEQAEAGREKRERCGDRRL